MTHPSYGSTVGENKAVLGATALFFRLKVKIGTPFIHKKYGRKGIRLDLLITNIEVYYSYLYSYLSRSWCATYLDLDGSVYG